MQMFVAGQHILVMESFQLIESREGILQPIRSWHRGAPSQARVMKTLSSDCRSFLSEQAVFCKLHIDLAELDQPGSPFEFERQHARHGEDRSFERGQRASQINHSSTLCVHRLTRFNERAYLCAQL